MDSLTQMVLGATVGEAVLGKKAGRRALFWGAFAGTVPDLDVLVYPLWNDVERLVLHRGFSHSLLVLALAAPLLGGAVKRIHGNLDVSWREWSWLMFWCLITHPLLDCFTTYGTQLAWPFSSYPVSWNSIFIIDPLYTLPLLFATITGLWSPKDRDTRTRIITMSLLLSSSYLALTQFNKHQALAVFREAIVKEPQLRGDGRWMTMPGVFNNVVWRGLYLEDDTLYESYYSFFGDKERVRFRVIQRGKAVRARLGEHEQLERLIRFSKGFYLLRQEPDRVVYTDVRFGGQDYYAFRYQIHPDQTDKDRQVTRLPRAKPPEDYLANVWRLLKGEPYLPAEQASNQPPIPKE
ncbi:metal-dependent hydrolase [Acanthopleuribacter pedis]|uniref:Metal-dependent hydrolase n=1 Tax=Acanthopleuribacter pedis TaxID=442870 RepID=A0A8J7QD28_9BACT|nr:metal-dependent hydrolase [Acanthopleuribacter pedis]MBO1322302.1 metal-dependent hydrolase [Acanthopleuribacter pedis]